MRGHRLISVAVWFDSLYDRVSKMTAIWMVGHMLRSRLFQTWNNDHMNTCSLIIIINTIIIIITPHKMKD